MAMGLTSMCTSAMPFGVKRTIQKDKIPYRGASMHSTICGTANKVGFSFTAPAPVAESVRLAMSLPTFPAINVGRVEFIPEAATPAAPFRQLPASRAVSLGGKQERHDSTWPLKGNAEAAWHFAVVYPNLLHSEQLACQGKVTEWTVDQCQGRWHVVDWIVSCHLEFELSHLTLFLAIRLLDRSLAISWVPRERLRKLGATALLIASKFEDECYPDHFAMASFSNGQFQPEELHDAELEMLAQLEFRFHEPTVGHHLRWFLKLCNGDNTNMYDQQYGLACYLADLGLYSPELLSWMPTQHAAAAVFLSNLLMSRASWPRAFENAVVHGKESRREVVREIATELMRVLRSSRPGQAVYDKHEEFDRTSSFAIRLAALSMGPDWRHGGRDPSDQ